MKKITIIVLVGLSLFGQPARSPIELEPGKTAVKIDDMTLELTTTYKQIVEKRELLEEKQMYEDEITRAQKEIAKIDAMLAVFD